MFEQDADRCLEREAARSRPESVETYEIEHSVGDLVIPAGPCPDCGGRDTSAMQYQLWSKHELLVCWDCREQTLDLRRHYSPRLGTTPRLRPAPEIRLEDCFKVIR